MLSFFDDTKASGPIISKSKKPLPKPRPATTPSSSSNTPSRPSIPLKPSLNRPGSSSSVKSAVKSQKSSPVSTPKKRKLVEQRIESESEGSSEDESVKEEEVSREIKGKWCLSKVDERGEWGRGWAGFVTSEEAMKGDIRGWAGGERSGNLDKYVAYFPQEGFERESLPSVELLYPAGCRERFILLAPTSAREYSPISELRTALRTILDHYIPPSHQGIFGTLSDSMIDLDTVVTPSPISTPPPDGITETIGDALRKSLAPNRRDGPGFLKAMQRFNDAMEEVRPSMKIYMDVDIVHEQAYSRVVGPYSNELEHHPKHPDEVARAISAKEDAYGELRHKFMQRIIEQTGLSKEHVFVDLGSGVGNCVVQAALEAGCRSYGFELLPIPAHCARLQLRETQRRWAMWGLKGNLNVEAHEGDFRTHSQVAKRLREADVVLVNNEVFPPSLNADLTNLFLDLKEGAQIVSLKPFVPDSFKMNEANCDSFAAIVKMSQHTYYRDWVSWKGDSGTYYLQVIDRSMRRKFDERGRRQR